MKGFEISWSTYKSVVKLMLTFTIVLIVLTFVNLISKQYKFDETSISLICLTIFLFLATVFLYLLTYVSKLRVYDDRIEKVSIVGKLTTYKYEMIDMRYNGLAIDIIDSEGKTLFRVSSFMTNADNLINSFYSYSGAKPKKKRGVEVITANFYYKNFGIFLLVFSSLILYFTISISYTYGYGVDSYIALSFGVFFALLGIVLLLHYYLFSIRIDSQNLYIKTKHYPKEKLYIKTTLNTVSVFNEKERRIKFLNINFYNNWEALYYLKNRDHE